MPTTFWSLILGIHLCRKQRLVWDKMELDKGNYLTYALRASGEQWLIEPSSRIGPLKFILMVFYSIPFVILFSLILSGQKPYIVCIKSFWRNKNYILVDLCYIYRGILFESMFFLNLYHQEKN